MESAAETARIGIKAGWMTVMAARRYVRRNVPVRRADYPRTKQGQRRFNRDYQRSLRGSEPGSKRDRVVTLTGVYPDTDEGRRRYRLDYGREWRRINRHPAKARKTKAPCFCGGKTVGRGLCKNHYQRWRRSGMTVEKWKESQ